MKWALFMLTFLAIVVLLAFAPAARAARARSEVFSLPIQINAVDGIAAPFPDVFTIVGWNVHTDRGDLIVKLACGHKAPQIGSALAQYIKYRNSVETRTLHAGGCSYEIVS